MFRYYIALWIAKLSIIALKITGHKGTNFPGIVALKICPDFLKLTAKPKLILGVTGTNGKTTVTNIMIDMLRADGKKVIDNNMGSNTITGIIASFIYCTTLGGKCNYDVAMLEIDERSVRVLFPCLQPDYLLINNLTRDSIMRNGHPEFISKVLTRHMPESTKLIINGDDLIAAGVAPGNERVYFSIAEMDGDVKECINLINDMQICPKCHSVLKYDYLRYHHIGKAYCPNCDFKSPESEYTADKVDIKNMTVDVSHNGIRNTYKLLNDSVFNIYNIVAVVSYMQELGYKPERVKELLDNCNIVATRYDVVEAGAYRIIKQMSKDKNALASSRVFDYISTQPGNKEIILMMNCLHDTVQWSENVCWLYDCDFEFLNRKDIKNIICTGPRAKDYYLRLKMAGVNDENISLVDDEMGSPDMLKLGDNKDIYVLFGTDSIELADKVVEKIKSVIMERGQK